MAIPSPAGKTPDPREDGNASMRVRTCSRVGLTANPPRRRLGNLLRRR